MSATPVHEVESSLTSPFPDETQSQFQGLSHVVVSTSSPSLHLPCLSVTIPLSIIASHWNPYILSEQPFYGVAFYRCLTSTLFLDHTRVLYHLHQLALFEVNVISFPAFAIWKLLNTPLELGWWKGFYDGCHVVAIF